MKSSRFVFLILFFYGCSVHTQTNSPGEAAQKIFAALKAKDEKAFMALCPDSTQLVRILKKFEENARAKREAERKAWEERVKNYPQSSSFAALAKTDSLADALLRKNYSPEGIKEMQERYRACFRFMLEKGEKRGFDWSRAALTTYTVDTTGPDQQTLYFFLAQSGYKSANGVLHFKAGQEAFKMSFGEVLFLPEENGWYGAVPYKLVRENERLEDDHEGEETTEITLSSIVEDLPPPPPPPPLKAKGKPSSTKGKTKR